MKQICRNCKYCIKITENHFKKSKYFCVNYDSYPGCRVSINTDKCKYFTMKPRSVTNWIEISYRWYEEYQKLLYAEMKKIQKENEVITNWINRMPEKAKAKLKNHVKEK